MYCKNCGVELEDEMPACPLCGKPVGEDATDTNVRAYGTLPVNLHKALSKTQKKFAWDIVSIILFAGTAAAFIVDFIISRRITWSEYTTAIGLTIFCYVSVFAFWDQRTFIRLAGGFVLSAICLLILDVVTGGIDWSTRLAVPLLFISTLITALFINIIQVAKYKGINLIAYAFLGAGILCMCIEGIISVYRSGSLAFNWGIIVSVCILPVSIVLLFVHFRLRKGQSLRKTFHV